MKALLFGVIAAATLMCAVPTEADARPRGYRGARNYYRSYYRPYRYQTYRPYAYRPYVYDNYYRVQPYSYYNYGYYNYGYAPYANRGWAGYPYYW